MTLTKLIELSHEQRAKTDCTDGHLMADVLADGVMDLFGEDQPCMIPEPKLLPGIMKIEIPEEAAGLWDLDDACAFAIMILKLRDKAEP